MVFLFFESCFDGRKSNVKIEQCSGSEIRGRKKKKGYIPRKTLSLSMSRIVITKGVSLEKHLN